MDRQNVIDLGGLSAASGRAPQLYLKATLGLDRDVPDPYYGDDRDFDAVFDLCDRAARALVDKLKGGQAAKG